MLTRLHALADAQKLVGWHVGVDSTICRAHRHAAGRAVRRSRVRGRRSRPSDAPEVGCRPSCIWPANGAGGC
ncbi:hypothetical protein FXF51_11505 [Nonomuraea sp. PA05]|nr:hypothetical protein FXF51_11505 [Nonomuraea sp. PA05]